MRMTHPLLECFDDPQQDVPPPGPPQAYLDGHAAGLAEGRADALAELARQTSGLREALDDLTFQYAEARQHVLSSLEPLIKAICDKILPDLAREVVGPTVVDWAMAAARQQSGVTPTITVHSGMIPVLEQAFEKAPDERSRFEVDDLLGDGQIVLGTPDLGETLLDYPALLAEVRSRLEALFDFQVDPQERMTSDG